MPHRQRPQPMTDTTPGQDPTERVVPAGTQSPPGRRSVTLRGFAIDYDPLPFTQGDILAVDRENGSFTVRIHDGYALPGLPDTSGWQGCFIEPETRRYTHPWLYVGGTTPLAERPRGRVRGRSGHDRRATMRAGPRRPSRGRGPAGHQGARRCASPPVDPRRPEAGRATRSMACPAARSRCRRDLARDVPGGREATGSRRPPDRQAPSPFGSSVPGRRRPVTGDPPDLRPSLAGGPPPSSIPAAGA